MAFKYVLETILGISMQYYYFSGYNGARLATKIILKKKKKTTASMYLECNQVRRCVLFNDPQ
jgi:hypothetical protein